MQFTSVFASVMALAGMAAAAGDALVKVERSHGGAGNDITSTTIVVPLGEVFKGDPALEAVSTLYLVGATNHVDMNTITCTPYQSDDATGTHGLAFDSKTPSRLSTNTVVVGSILCETTS
ncbi:hypothetical protein GGR52DRAFT_571357 [Hypoxylon sp. FL1284]|nr:hypothetical protein GGR52DRAFT_571357 [Hypoxylon sp. FL1284]